MTDTHAAGPDELFEQAAAWYFRLQAEDLQAGERLAFDAWLATGTAQAEAWQEALALMGALQAPAQAIAGPVPRRRLWRRPVQWASAALVLLVAGMYTLQSPQMEDWRADHHTGVGEISTIHLADGSTLQLNTNTAVKVQVDAGQRHVQLLRGEAWFDIKPDPQRRFTVSSGAGQVTVLGTAFSVSEENTSTRVQVERGRVQVADGLGRDTQLLPGERIVYDGSGLLDVAAFDPAVAFAWRQRQLVFQQQPLSEVISELQRYQRGVILVRGQALREQVVSGVFDIDRPDAVIDALEHILGLRAVRYGPYLLILQQS